MQCPFVSEEEVQAVSDFLRAAGRAGLRREHPQAARRGRRGRLRRRPSVGRPAVRRAVAIVAQAGTARSAISSASSASATTRPRSWWSDGEGGRRRARRAPRPAAGAKCCHRSALSASLVGPHCVCARITVCSRYHLEVSPVSEHSRLIDLLACPKCHAPCGSTPEGFVWSAAVVLSRSRTACRTC